MAIREASQLIEERLHPREVKYRLLGPRGHSIVIPAREDSDFRLRNLVNKTMFLIYPAGPAALEFMLQWLGLADSSKWVALSHLIRLTTRNALLRSCRIHH